MIDNHNWLYRNLMLRALRNVEASPAQIAKLKEIAQHSTVVYVIRHCGHLEYSFFNGLFINNGLPLAGFTNAVQMWRWMKYPALKNCVVASLKDIEQLGHIKDPSANGNLRELIEQGMSPLLLISQSNLEDDGLFFSGSANFFTSIIEAHTKGQKPVTIVPLDIVWSRKPENERRTISDILFGEKEAPGLVRRLTLLAKRFGKHGQAIIGQPIELKEFLGNAFTGDPLLKAGELRDKIMNSFKTERRTLTGPPIRPKRWFVNEVMNDEKLDTEICRLAAVQGIGADELRGLARKYALEIIADVDHTYIELFERIITFVFRRIFDEFHIDPNELREIKELYAKGPVVFVPNHKSHADYLLLSHILYRNGMTIPHIAAGINLKFWPLGHIFRKCGAYFIRREFKDNPLYKAVLESYLKVLLKEGYSHEFFIEGGRTRTGNLGKPRYGMITMLTHAAAEAGIKDIWFVPVTITYDRVIEQKSYVQEVEGRQKEKEKTTHILRLFEHLKPKGQRYGSVYIRFGKPLKNPDGTCERAQIEDTAAKICERINSRVVVTPTALAATALLASTLRGVTDDELTTNWEVIAPLLTLAGAEFSSKMKLARQTAISEALLHFTRARLVIDRRDSMEPFFHIEESKRTALSFFKNSIIHFLLPVCMASRAILSVARTGGGISVQSVKELYKSCEEIMTFQFAPPKEISPAARFDDAMSALASHAKIVISGDRITIDEDSVRILGTLACLIKPFIETFMIATTHALNRIVAPTDERVLIAGMLSSGNDLYLLNKIHHKESISQMGIAEAVKSLVKMNVLSVKGETKDRRAKIYDAALDKDLLPRLKAILERLL